MRRVNYIKDADLEDFIQTLLPRWLPRVTPYKWAEGITSHTYVVTAWLVVLEDRS